MKRMEECDPKDLKVIEVHENEWYEEADRSRAGWKATSGLGLESNAGVQTAAAQVSVLQLKDVTCQVCFRCFRG